jgi:hypothetical protein
MMTIEAKNTASMLNENLLDSKDFLKDELKSRNEFGDNPSVGRFIGTEFLGQHF